MRFIGSSEGPVDLDDLEPSLCVDREVALVRAKDIVNWPLIGDILHDRARPAPLFAVRFSARQSDAGDGVSAKRQSAECRFTVRVLRI